MNRAGFRAYLTTRQASDGLIDFSVALAERFEAFVRRNHHVGPERASADAARAFVHELAKTGENTFDAVLALARFGRFVKNHPILIAMLEIVDGHEAFANLYQRVEEETGACLRDEVFDGVDTPPLGISNLERARRMRTVVERLELKLGRERASRLLKQGLRDLPDAGYDDERREFEAAGSFDEYLRRKGDRFIAELRRIRDQGDLFFSQPITDAVIAHVDSHPEIRQGVRVGDVLYEAKIPYMADEYLREKDPQRRAYLYCHCPWARESLQKGERRVSQLFCNCSAAFHRKPYEAVFGQRLESDVVESVLAGDPWCRFAIHLPQGVA